MATHFFNFKLHNQHNSINLANVDEKRYRYGNLLIFACFFLYASSMAAKGVFAAQIKFIVDLWGLEYATASMANTYYFVTYGLVQVGLFFFMSKINMRKYMLWTIPISAVTTALIGVATKIQHIWIFFGLSGAFQASIYCGCNLMLTKYLPLKLLSRGNVLMNLGYATGTVVAYLLSALFIGFGGENWRIPYFIIGIIFFASIICFGVIVYISRRFAKINGMLDKKLTAVVNTENTDAMNDDDPLITLKTTRKRIIFYAVDLVMVFLITSLYYCAMNYITSLLVDVHGLSQDVSIYVSIVAPVAIALGPMMVIRSCDHHKDFVRQAFIFGLVLLPIPLMLALFYSVNMWLALGLSVIFVIIANGIKSVVLSVMTFKMRKVMNAGAYSAISNAVASISAGITPTLMGVVLDVSGWTAYYYVTFGLAVFVLLVTFIIDLIVRRDYKREHNVNSNTKI
ncbi:MAG: MFS transporter [Clostridia bacterium]|nr:MFS transporter [Clostridia bacterium]